MKPVKFKDYNGTLGRPENMTEEECGALPIKRTENNGYPSIESVWELSDEEIETVIKSKRIRFGILGKSQPPIYMGVEPA